MSSKDTTTQNSPQISSAFGPTDLPANDYAQGPLVYQRRSATAEQEQGRPETNAESAQPPDDGQAGVEGRADSPDSFYGPDVKEAFDTENHAGDDNKVSGSENTRIGAPATVSIRNFSAKRNHVVNSTNTSIGRW
jgi:hypothetical protein